MVIERVADQFGTLPLNLLQASLNRQFLLSPVDQSMAGRSDCCDMRIQAFFASLQFFVLPLPFVLRVDSDLLEQRLDGEN